tara:strand:- start:20878 stop:21069 length:192 start_codon:yes stop_codon:yes gene_type:complete
MRKIKPTRSSTRSYAWKTLKDIKAYAKHIEMDTFETGLTKKEQEKLTELKEQLSIVTEICKSL